MKVLIVTPTYFPIVGGAEKAIYAIGKRLVNSGVEVTILTRTFKEEAAYDQPEMNIHRLALPMSKMYGLSGPWVPITRFVKLFRKISELCRREEFDIIHQFYVFSFGAACVLAKKYLKKPLVTSLTGWDTYDPFKPVPKMLNPYQAWVMNNSDIVTSLSQELATHAKERGCKRDIRIIPAGVDVYKFNPNVDGSEVRRKLQLQEGEIIILAIQRLDQRKRLDYLIGAMPKVTKENQKIKLVIGGKGPEQENLELLVAKLDLSKSVVFAGFIPEEHLPEYYAACDIFVLHTAYEAFGIVLAEAMASGKPVVSTRAGAVPEVIEEGKTGLLVPPMDSDALADAISKLVYSKQTAIEMAEEGRKKAEQEYDWDRIVERYIDIYRELKH